MALEPAPLTWLESLARESIHSWEDLKKASSTTYKGHYTEQVFVTPYP